MGLPARFFVAGLAVLAGLAAARADEPMEGSFLASRSCEALVSIRKDSNPGMAFTAAGQRYRLLARNDRKAASHYRIEMPDAAPPERWVRVDCGKVLPPAAAAAPPPLPPPAAKPPTASRSYVLALSWQPTFCEANPNKPECRAQTGKRQDANSLSLHGLWPQPSTLAYCNLPGGVRAAGEGGRWRDLPPVDLSLSTRADLEAMMPGTRSLLERHEWAKHGTCYGTDSEGYFADSLRLLKDVNSSPVGELLRQNVGRRVTTADIRAAFDQAFGRGAGNRVRVACRDAGDRRLIAEVTLGLKGDIAAGARLSDLLLAASPVEPGCPAGVLDQAGPH